MVDDRRSPPGAAAVLDRVHLARQTAGDAALQAELIALFAAQCARLTPMVAGEGAAQERADAAHALKGGALGVGAFATARAAEAAENSLRETGRLPQEVREALTAAVRAFSDHVRGGA